MPQSHRPSTKPALDLSGHKFIRMMMASYFIALSVGVIQGVDMTLFFRPFMDPLLAHEFGSAVVLFCAALLFFGLYLRPTALYLATMVLTSSIIENLFTPSAGSLDAFWRDLVIVCGLLLMYCTLDRRNLRRQAFINSGPAVSRMDHNGKVSPRRVTIGKSGLTASSPLVIPRPKKAPAPAAEPVPAGLNAANCIPFEARQKTPEDDTATRSAEPTNIFAAE